MAKETSPRKAQIDAAATSRLLAAVASASTVDEVVGIVLEQPALVGVSRPRVPEPIAAAADSGDMHNVVAVVVGML